MRGEKGGRGREGEGRRGQKDYQRYYSVHEVANDLDVWTMDYQGVTF